MFAQWADTQVCPYACMNAVAVDERFLKGLELFNEERFFECHEVIESLWLETPSDDAYRDLYKGVIQAAAALYQFQRGILSGAQSLCKSSAGYLRKYAPSAMGLNVKKLINDMQIFFENSRDTARRAPTVDYEP